MHFLCTQSATTQQQIWDHMVICLEMKAAHVEGQRVPLFIASSTVSNLGSASVHQHI